jgi:copper(I)-binding protein
VSRGSRDSVEASAAVTIFSRGQRSNRYANQFLPRHRLSCSRRLNGPRGRLQNRITGHCRSVYSRATPKGATVGAGYMKITNNGTAPDRLISSSSDVAGKVEVHEMTMDKGVMKMRPLKGGLEIKPGETVILKPGSFHVMFVGLKKPLRKGDHVKATLVFEKAGKGDVDFDVLAMGAKPGADMPGMKMQRH